MKVDIRRVDNAFHFEAMGDSGFTIHIDGSKESGGNNAGARPMELILMALGSCSAFDVVTILNKQKQEISDFRIEVRAERAKQTPAVFTKIHLHYRLHGRLQADKVEKAINLSIEKYCSVYAMLIKSVEITHSYEVHDTVAV